MIKDYYHFDRIFDKITIKETKELIIYGLARYLQKLNGDIYSSEKSKEYLKQNKKNFKNIQKFLIPALSSILNDMSKGSKS